MKKRTIKKVFMCVVACLLAMALVAGCGNTYSATSTTSSSTSTTGTQSGGTISGTISNHGTATSTVLLFYTNTKIDLSAYPTDAEKYMGFTTAMTSALIGIQTRASSAAAITGDTYTFSSVPTGTYYVYMMAVDPASPTAPYLGGYGASLNTLADSTGVQVVAGGDRTGIDIQGIEYDLWRSASRIKNHASFPL